MRLSYISVIPSILNEKPRDIDALSYQDTLYFLHLSMCLRLGLVYVNYFAIIIFVTINHITSLIQQNFFLEVFAKCLLSLCLIFRKFQPGFANKIFTYKKNCVTNNVHVLQTTLTELTDNFFEIL